MPEVIELKETSKQEKVLRSIEIEYLRAYATGKVKEFCKYFVKDTFEYLKSKGLITYHWLYPKLTSKGIDFLDNENLLKMRDYNIEFLLHIAWGTPNELLYEEVPVDKFHQLFTERGCIPENGNKRITVKGLTLLDKTKKLESRIYLHEI